MFTHIVLGSNNIAAAKKFYDAVFEAAGAQPATEVSDQRLAYRHNGSALIIKTPLNGEPASVSNGATIGLAFETPESVDAWHNAGQQAGGTSVEDPPGLRERHSMQYYAAYLRDPDGNKLCAVCMKL